MGRHTHILSLTVMVDGPEKWGPCYQKLLNAAEHMAVEKMDFSLSSNLVEEDILDKSYEAFTENTLSKVSAALIASGIRESQINYAIHAMQNYGILFRERVQ